MIHNCTSSLSQGFVFPTGDSGPEEMSEKRASRVSTTQSLSAISEDEIADDDIVDIQITTAPDGGYGWVRSMNGWNRLSMDAFCIQLEINELVHLR